MRTKINFLLLNQNTSAWILKKKINLLKEIGKALILSGYVSECKRDRRIRPAESESEL